MEIELLTKEDLQLFRQQLLADIKAMLTFKPNGEKYWLRSSEVRTLLKISAGTLQNLRVTGILKASRIGGIYYYRMTEIERLLDSGFGKEQL